MKFRKINHFQAIDYCTKAATKGRILSEFGSGRNDGFLTTDTSFCLTGDIQLIPRMIFLVDFFEPFAVNMGVYLRC